VKPRATRLPATAAKALRAHPLLAALEECSRAAAPARGVWLVGGALRDALLGRPVLDLDAAAVGAHLLAQRLARQTKASCVVLDAENGVYRVVPRGGGPHVDVAELQGKDILSDLGRRDFTLNALALELPLAAGAPLLDPHGGLADLRRRRLRRTTTKVFRDDPLRMLRVFRIAAQCGLRVEPATLSAVRRERGLLRRSASERARAELLTLLAVPDSAPWLKAMDEVRLLTALLPELESSRTCAKVYYGAGGVLKHALEVVARMDFVLSDLEAVFGALGARVREHLRGLGAPAGDPAFLKLAALLHDVAKPATARRIDGRLRFFGHDLLGGRMAAEILRRLRCSREEVRVAALLAEHHLRPGNLAAADVVSDKAVYRFFRDLGPLGVPQLLLCWADHASYLPPAALRRVLRWAAEDPHGFRPPRALDADTAKTLRHLQLVSWLMSRWFLAPATARPERLLDGKEVMKTLGIPPSPRVGEALALLEEAQAEGRVRTREDALAFLRRLPPAKDVSKKLT
jgi:tRNA nucleotidyltransferase/poly(A) polymerase